MQRMLARVVRTSPIRPAGVFVRPTLEVGPSALLPAQGAVSSSRWQQLHCAAGARGYTSSSSSSLPSAPYYSADSHNHPLLGAHNVFRQHSLGRTVHQVRLANIPSHDPSNTPQYFLQREPALPFLRRTVRHWVIGAMFLEMAATYAAHWRRLYRVL